MKLRDAIDVVLNEAESSALGENNQEIMEAITLLHDFLEWVADDIKIWDEMTNDGFILQDFLNDANKMKDFELLDKQEFLKKHPFIKEKEYNLTRLKQKEQGDI
tara:strand:+ start:1760 stop:2071 length:312 start_codon:yes stop_codon:yes gene_type:complete